MAARIWDRRLVGLGVIAATVLAVPTVTFSAQASNKTWQVVKTKSASGPHPAMTISATIRHPQGIAVRLSSPAHVAGTVYWACSKGFHGEHGHFELLGGFHALPHVRGQDSCHILVAAHGFHRITVAILKIA